MPLGYIGHGMSSVTINGMPLPGYDGSDPAQLARAILADRYGDGEYAARLAPAFATHVIAGLPQGNWRLLREDVDMAVDFIEASQEG